MFQELGILSVIIKITGDKINRFRKAGIVIAMVKNGHFMTGFHCLVNAVKRYLAGAADV